MRRLGFLFVAYYKHYLFIKMDFLHLQRSLESRPCRHGRSEEAKKRGGGVSIAFADNISVAN
jgi:hypothetical protein